MPFCDVTAPPELSPEESAELSLATLVGAPEGWFDGCEGVVGVAGTQDRREG